MMKLTLMFLLLLFQQDAVETALQVATDSRPVLETGEYVNLNISLTVGRDKSQYSVVLLPLDVEGFLVKSVSSNTSTAGSVFDVPRQITFHVTLEALETGNGILNEIQVELSPPGDDNKGELLTHPGFTAQIIAPFPWGDYIPWIIGGALVAVSGIILYFRFFNRFEKGAGSKLSPEHQRRNSLLVKMDEHKIRGEWDKIVEVAYNAILEENFSKNKRGIAAGVTISSDDIERLTEQWPDFPAVYRLGEEVRYGGYQAQKQEAVFMIKFSKDYFTKLNQEEKRTEEAA